jgi:hypothetical protein
MLAWNTSGELQCRSEHPARTRMLAIQSILCGPYVKRLPPISCMVFPMPPTFVSLMKGSTQSHAETNPVAMCNVPGQDSDLLWGHPVTLVWLVSYFKFVHHANSPDLTCFQFVHHANSPLSSLCIMQTVPTGVDKSDVAVGAPSGRLTVGQITGNAYPLPCPLCMATNIHCMDITLGHWLKSYLKVLVPEFSFSSSNPCYCLSS